MARNTPLPVPHQVRGDEDILRHALKGADTVERLGKRHRFVRHDALGDGGGEYIIMIVTSAEFRTGACFFKNILHIICEKMICLYAHFFNVVCYY